MKIRLMVAILLASVSLGYAQTNYLSVADRAKTSNTAVAWTNDIVGNLRASSQFTNVVEQLAKDGDICRIMGHQWHVDGGTVKRKGGPLDLWPDKEIIFHRNCGICGKVQVLRKAERWEAE